MKPNILISGASIAGPALAFWLTRHGFQVTVVERAPALREGGYAVDIRGAAMAVVERMGLREAMRPLQTDTVCNQAVDARGRRFGRMARGFGVIDPDDVEIHRGDLARLLYDATRADVDYRFGDGLDALAADADGVTVEFERGGRGRFDAVIGADGVHSRTRALAFGPERDFLRPLGSLMAIFSVPNHLRLDREQLLFSALGRIASIKSADDNRHLKVCVFFTGAPNLVDAFDARDVDGQRRLVHAAFVDAGWEFPRLVDGMLGADDFYCDVTCQIDLARYYAGRVALVGDAAYCPSPLSGQGTSLALVGAYMLARALDRSRDDLAAGLARYDGCMRAFATRNQKVALKIANGFAPRTPFQVWLRNAMMKSLPYLPGASAMVKLAMRDIARTARAIDLDAAA